MAGRKLTEEERQNFAARNALSKASSAADKAKASGIEKDKIKINARTAEQIDAAIAKAKADPKFQAREAKLKAAMEAKGTQPGHAVTTSSNNTKPVKSSGRGAISGPIGDIGGGGMNWETK